MVVPGDVTPNETPYVGVYELLHTSTDDWHARP